jgi:Outer membrane lipoprotein carrier protein LolA-like
MISGVAVSTGLHAARTLRPRLVLLCVLGLAAPLLVRAQQPDIDRVMSALAARKHGHVSFTERKSLAMLERPVESSGELLYDAPDHLEKRTVKPRPESLVLDGGVITAQRGPRRYVLNLQQYPQIVPFIESIRATLAGDRAALERVFKLDFDGHFDHWALALRPLDAQLARTVKEIHIQGDADQVHTVEVVEADGDRSLLQIGPEISP